MNACNLWRALGKALDAANAETEEGEAALIMVLSASLAESGNLEEAIKTIRDIVAVLMLPDERAN